MLTLTQRKALAVNPKSTTMVLSSTTQNHYRPNKDPLKTRDLTHPLHPHHLLREVGLHLLGEVVVSEKSTSSSSESSQPSKRTPSKPLSAGKTILKPRAVDLEDSELNAAFPEVLNFFKFQSWQPFISEFRIIYPRLVQEFYMHLECTDEGYKSKVKGIEIDMPTDIAATIFKIPDEGEDYHNFEFNLHEAYTILTGLPADESDPKQTHVTKFNTNTFPPVLRLTHHILTNIITPQGGGRDRLTDIQRFLLYCMSKDINVNLHVIMYQIISETTRADLHRSLPYAAHLTQVFKHFGVSLENEKSEKIPKSNIYCFKNVQKFMGFRIVGDKVRRGPAAVEAPVVQEDQPPVQEDQPPAPEDQPQVHEDQPPMNEDQPHVAVEVDVPFNAPRSPQLQPSSSMNLETEIPSFSPQPPVHASTSFGGPSVPPELYTFLNDKFDALNTSIQTMSKNFELRIQRLENTVSGKFIEQKVASDHATQSRVWDSEPQPVGLFHRPEQASLLGQGGCRRPWSLRRLHLRRQIEVKRRYPSEKKELDRRNKNPPQAPPARRESLSSCHHRCLLLCTSCLFRTPDRSQGQHFLTKVVSTQPSVVSTKWLRARQKCEEKIN
ncbi:hypothetical protein Taro_054139 [Colocasia esculenta]|uniref:Putative plant transposon protein domain-containing protein n=1 Tax=Colocasia esculenta TaxID=4460 RepID=A0A843XQ70_COLES|nr:hypothetical protein [Colocasia esculenta]